MSYGPHLWPPAGFPIDFAYEKLAVKIANSDHKTIGMLQQLQQGSLIKQLSNEYSLGEYYLYQG